MFTTSCWMFRIIFNIFKTLSTLLVWKKCFFQRFNILSFQNQSWMGFQKMSEPLISDQRSGSFEKMRTVQERDQLVPIINQSRNSVMIQLCYSESNSEVEWLLSNWSCPMQSIDRIQHSNNGCATNISTQVQCLHCCTVERYDKDKTDKVRLKVS